MHSADRALIAEGKTIALVTCSIHSTEVGSTQMALEFVHDVATTEDPELYPGGVDAIMAVRWSISAPRPTNTAASAGSWAGTPGSGARPGAGAEFQLELP